MLEAKDQTSDSRNRTTLYAGTLHDSIVHPVTPYHDSFTHIFPALPTLCHRVSFHPSFIHLISPFISSLFSSPSSFSSLSPLHLTLTPPQSPPPPRPLPPPPSPPPTLQQKSPPPSPPRVALPGKVGPLLAALQLPPLTLPGRVTLTTLFGGVLGAMVP
jgi:hypothetical protein